MEGRIKKRRKGELKKNKEEKERRIEEDGKGEWKKE